MHEFVVFCCGSDLHLHQLLGRVCGRGETSVGNATRTVLARVLLLVLVHASQLRGYAPSLALQYRRTPPPWAEATGPIDK